MGFSSASSKAQTKSTLQKLLSNHLPGSQIIDPSVTPAPTASASVLSAQLSRKVNAEEIKKIAKNQKIKERKKILKKAQETKKFNKLAKYNLIKLHKNKGQLTPEESKFLNKLVKRNVASLNSLSSMEDDMKDEFKNVQKDILSAINPAKQKKKNTSKNEFKTKIEKGFISYPGLTPGLAPIDYNESEEE